nr:hypothetical protein [Tanacetum cinerariifolium]
MSSPNHPFKIEHAFSSNFPDYVLASSNYLPTSLGNNSPNSSDNFTKYLLATLVFLPLHDNQYMEVMPAYDATDNELPIPEISPKDTETFESPTVQQRIRLYCSGKENGVNILKSIDEGPFLMGTVREPLAEGTEWAPQLCPERPRVYSDLSPKEKDRCKRHLGQCKDAPRRVRINQRRSGVIAAQENGVALDAEQLLFLAGGQDNAIDDDVDEQHIQDLALNIDNMFQDPVMDEAGPLYDSDILSEVQDHDHYQDAVCAHHEEHVMHDNVQLNHVVDSHADYTSDGNMIPYDKHDAIERKNLLIANDNLIAKCLSKEVFSVATNSKLNVARFTKMHAANTIVEARCLELKDELSNLRDKSDHDNHEELVNRFSKLELNHLNLQLKYQNLKDSFRNNPPTPDKDTPDFDSVFVIGKMQASLQGKDNAIRQLKNQISHLQETRSDTDRTLKVWITDSQITQLTETVTNLQAQMIYLGLKMTKLSSTTKNSQILDKVNSVSKDHVKPKVLSQGKYAIDVEPIVPRLRNNREAHLNYLRHLKESVETIYDIVEEAKVVRPLDSSIVFACRYTKHSQELFEYAIGTCPQDSHQRDKKLAPPPLIRKKESYFRKTV